MAFGPIGVTIDGQTVSGGCMQPLSMALNGACDATRDDCVVRTFEHLGLPINDTVTASQTWSPIVLDGSPLQGRQELCRNRAAGSCFPSG